MEVLAHHFNHTHESSVTGFGIGKIIDSKNPTFPIVSTFFGPIHWESYSYLTKDQGLNESLAKRQGLRVIKSVGSDEKGAYLKNELGFDAAFNYKTQNKRQALTELAP
ncbi:hypothetical protein BGZ47_006007 [Haplosporangium gracile]|nr:hypothetical protein BGZ47_006007 [Haplosporangium gracile]